MKEYEFYVARVQGFEPGFDGLFFTTYVGARKPQKTLDKAFQFAGYSAAESAAFDLHSEIRKSKATHLNVDILHFKCEPSVINLVS